MVTDYEIHRDALWTTMVKRLLLRRYCHCTVISQHGPRYDVLVGQISNGCEQLLLAMSDDTHASDKPF